MTLLTVWIPGDQLLEIHPALEHAVAEVGRAHVRVVLIESVRKLTSRRWHRQKRVLVLSALRHYAEALRSRPSALRAMRSTIGRPSRSRRDSAIMCVNFSQTDW